MGPDRNTHLRNIAILLLITLAVWLIPGGDAAGDTLGNLLSIAFVGAIVFFAYRVYMERRMTLFGLSDRARAQLYGSFALAAITLVATARMWDQGGPGALAWFALMALALYGVYTVYRAAKEY